MRGGREMKKYIVCIVVALIACVAQVNAVEFKNTYKPTGTVYQPVVMPSVSFQSTSAYSAQWAEQPSMLNADGSVNTEAYMGNTGPAKSGPRKIESIGNPDEDPNDPGNVPIGDGLWVLMVLAVGYAGVRRARSTRFAK